MAQPNYSRADLNQPDSGERLPDRRAPFDWRNSPVVGSGVEELLRVHARPEQKVGRIAFPIRRSSLGHARLPPRLPFAAGKNRRREQPHEDPSGRPGAKADRQQRQKNQRQPTDPASPAALSTAMGRLPRRGLSKNFGHLHGGHSPSVRERGCAVSCSQEKRTGRERNIDPAIFLTQSRIVIKELNGGANQPEHGNGSGEKASQTVAAG